MSLFWEITYMLKDGNVITYGLKGDNVEEKEEHDDIDDVRAGYLYMTREEPDKYKYVAYKKS